VNPQRLLEGFGWSEFAWRRGELSSQFQGRTLLIGVDDMDVFKGIELKLQVRGLGWGGPGFQGAAAMQAGNNGSF
jgi:hypothetical protein